MQITVTLDLNDRAGTTAKIDDLCSTVSAYYAEKDRAATEGTMQGWEGKFGVGACRVYESLLTTITRKGSATLDDVAADTGWSLTTIRAHLMNAGRTAKAKGIAEPVDSTWNAELNCAVYTLPF